MNCKVKQCCAALAARKLAEHDPAVVEITRGEERTNRITCSGSQT